MTTSKNSLTEQQRENLKRIAYYLLEGKLKAKFDMGRCRYCIIGHYKTLHNLQSFGIQFISLGFYQYLFSPMWAYIDNTPTGAARRIIRYLSSGVPEGFTVPELKFKL